MRSRGHAIRRAPRHVLLVLLLAPLLAACEPTVNVEPTIELADPATETKVESLEAQVARLAKEADVERARADRLQAEVAELREENIVLATDAGWTFRLNAAGAVVLVFAIVGLTAFFIARMRYAAIRAAAEDTPPAS